MPFDMSTHCYVHSEVQRMKCNSRNTCDVPSPTVDLLLLKGHVPSHCLFVSYLLTVELEMHLPVTLKPWESTEKLQVFQEDCVTSQTDLNRPGTVVQKRHMIWETGSCHAQLLLLQCPPLPAPGANLCMQWPFHGWGVPSSCSRRVWGLFHSFVSFMSLPCHCLLAFLHLTWFLPFYCY